MDRAEIRIAKGGRETGVFSDPGHNGSARVDGAVQAHDERTLNVIREIFIRIEIKGDRDVDHR
jgi:hypothetical protein